MEPRILCGITPMIDTHAPGEVHEVVVTVLDLESGSPVPAAHRPVSLFVGSGPNASVRVYGKTDAHGEAVLGYVGAGGAGMDWISAECEDRKGHSTVTFPVAVVWGDDCDENGVPDECDLRCSGACEFFALCGLSDDVDGDGLPDQCATVEPEACLFGVDRVRLADRASTSGSVASHGRTELGADAESGRIDSAGRVVLRSRAVVDGDIVTGDVVRQQQHSEVIGMVTEHGGPELPTVPVVVAPDVDSGSFVVSSTTSHTLAPGGYGDVIVNSNATLVLDGVGDYAFSSLVVNEGSTLEYDAGSALFVRDGFTWRGEQVGEGPLPMSQTGSGWTHFEAGWDGAIVAPDASVRLAGSGSTTHTGARFVARRLLVEADTIVRCE